MPRTQETICGAPKAMAIPRMAPIHQPQEMRFAMAMPPSTITRMIAMGVSHARMLVSRAVAPVRKGEAWANAGSGRDKTAASDRARVTAVGDTASATVRMILLDMSRLRLLSVFIGSGFAAQPGGRDASRCAAAGPGRLLRARREPLRLLWPAAGALLALGLAGRAEAEALHDEVVVVVPLAVLVRPVVGANLGIDDQLVALAGSARDRLAERAEGREPDAGGDLPRAALLVLARVVIADQTELRVGVVSLDGELGVAGEIADGGEGETVHGRLLRWPLVPGWHGEQSREARQDWNPICLCVCIEMRIPDA